MRILLIVAVILALRFILNLSKYLRTNKYHDAYISWLAIERESKIVAVRAQVVALLKDAGVKDSYVGHRDTCGLWLYGDWERLSDGQLPECKGGLWNDRIGVRPSILRF